MTAVVAMTAVVLVAAPPASAARTPMSAGSGSAGRAASVGPRGVRVVARSRHAAPAADPDPGCAQDTATGDLGTSDTGTDDSGTDDTGSADTATDRYASIEPDLVIITTELPGAVGAGTGIVVSADGEVLTNNHVIAGGSRIVGQDLGDGRVYPVDVLGTDRRHDVALVRLRGATGLPVAPLGNSDELELGQPVAAVGNAGGCGAATIAAGQVTALNQTVTSQDEYQGTTERLHRMIRVDARVLPGDSGGSLVDQAGQVVGIDTAAQDNTTAGPPVGYAIPINEALAIARRLQDTGSSSVAAGYHHRRHRGDEEASVAPTERPLHDQRPTRGSR